MSQVDGVSGMAHQPAGSVALQGEGSEKGQWPPPAFLSGRKIYPPVPTLMPDTSVPPCTYATGAFQAATPVLELRGSEFV